jgi:hypothetical protein
MVSSVNAASAAPAVQNTPAVSQNARAPDGDYKTKGHHRSTVKDADGDYKPTTSQSTSSSAVQATLSNLKLGG